MARAVAFQDDRTILAYCKIQVRHRSHIQICEGRGKQLRDSSSVALTALEILCHESDEHTPNVLGMAASSLLEAFSSLSAT